MTYECRFNEVAGNSASAPAFVFTFFFFSFR